MLTIACILIFLIGVGAASEQGEEEKPEFVKVNTKEAVAGFKPLEGQLVSCLKLTHIEEMVGKYEAEVEIRMEIDENGKITHTDSGITYSGGIQVLPCFSETVNSVKLPPTGKKCSQIYRFKMDPYLEKKTDE